MQRIQAPEWERSYPTYKLGNTGIALAEYEAASARAQTDERAVSVVNGILVVATVPLFPTAAPLVRAIFERPLTPPEVTVNLFLFTAGVAFLSAVLIAFVCHQRRSFVHSARKIVVLRRMLGQSYGSTTLVLPNWRLEGADNPFAIRLFPGWHMRTAYPYYTLAVLLSALLAYGWYVAISQNGWAADIPYLPTVYVRQVAAALSILVLWSVVTLFYIRSQLFDFHESFTLSRAILLARLLRVRLVPGVQTSLYEARLASFEAKRIGIDLALLRDFAIFREDRRFFDHRGIDWKAVARAALQRLRGIKAGGGTTITQQLARTLFVVDLRKKLRRKCLEFPLGRWLDRLLPKDEQLDIYLSAVRYDRNVLGVAAALRHFFGRVDIQIDRPIAFLLVERISNNSSTFRPETVRLMIGSFLAEKKISESDVGGILDLYDQLIAKKLLSQNDGLTPADLRQGFKFLQEQLAS